MRVIAGEYRGKKLAPLKDAEIRPTGDRVKESVFQILTPRLYGARVLDLFCGSGALGIESLSRGAAEVVFNDISPESLQIARKNLQSIGRKCEMKNGSYESCILRVEGQFDIVFCDPPYKEDYCENILKLIAERKLLRENGIVVYESEREECAPAGWERFDLRRYGRCKVAFFSIKAGMGAQPPRHVTLSK